MTDDGDLRGMRLEGDESDALRAALTAAGLPADDIAEPGVLLFGFARDRTAVGYGGLELCGRDGLLRSVVVAAEARGEGVGRGIVDWLLDHAVRLGCERVWLFTTSARGYFEAQGFAAVERREAPASILSTRQGAGLCPATATVMVRILARGP
ncbi:amino-acid N-acetyltransferase [Roseiarcus fermentans]|uniref:Amino-acid N-acetyltransferase n=1 Tax=Roseiarcus fermentans TaxID=1473586 RepID=A0A366ERK9_9HYPH|nr:arsenic resistance N-acetyltransferase ArsN2 [Roseiarcus fermentans]RBP05062.1 amino-acid N-acetyltransferase [Roseiarcus fermentans]